VRYTPSLRGVALEVMSPPEAKLVPGETYRVTDIHDTSYLLVSGHSHPGGGLHWSEFSPTLFLPSHLADKAASLPESSFRATRVTLILTNDQRIHDVYLAGASEIAKVGQRLISSPDDLPFSMGQIRDIQ